MPVLALAMRDVMAPIGLPGARRGLKKLKVANVGWNDENVLAGDLLLIGRRGLRQSPESLS